MVRRGSSVRQTHHRVMCEVLRGILREALDPGGGDRLPVGSVPCRAVATLYMLLLNHPVDRRGRCRSCRRPGAVLGGRWRRCRVHGEAALWLTQPADFLAAHLTRELGPAGGVETRLPGRGPALGPEATGVPPRTPADPDGPPTTPQSPAASPPPLLPGGLPRAGRPDPDHGGAGEPSEGRRPRRGSSGAGSAPTPDISLLLAGVVA